MSRFTRMPRAAMALFLVALAAPSLVAGQAASNRPIFLALPQHFPDLDARAVLLRQPGRDIVILDESDASPETLRAALMVLRRVRRDHPVLADRGQLVPITGYAGRAGMSDDSRAELEAVLTKLRRRPLANVGNLGRGHWMRYGGR